MEVTDRRSEMHIKNPRDTSAAVIHTITARGERVGGKLWVSACTDPKLTKTTHCLPGAI